MTAHRLPDFIIGGAPRSGTTWLYALADLHPDIGMAKPAVPEPKFFLRDDLYSRGLNYYSRTWFSSIAPGKVAGEKSTNYLESPVAAQRIRLCLPEVRLVFVLRNPVDRAFSNYLWSRQNGLEGEDFACALDREIERERQLPEALRFARPHALFSRGLYADLLKPYFDLFSRDRILVLRCEDISSSPTEIGDRLHRFLGVTPRPEDARDLPPLNAARDAATAKMDSEIRGHLLSRYRDPNRRLANLLGSNFTIWDH